MLIQTTDRQIRVNKMVTKSRSVSSELGQKKNNKKTQLLMTSGSDQQKEAKLLITQRISM